MKERKISGGSLFEEHKTVGVIRFRAVIDEIWLIWVVSPGMLTHVSYPRKEPPAGRCWYVAYALRVKHSRPSARETLRLSLIRTTNNTARNLTLES